MLPEALRKAETGVKKKTFFPNQSAGFTPKKSHAPNKWNMASSVFRLRSPVFNDYLTTFW